MDEFNRTWILENALEEISTYEKGVLTLRGLHYRMVSRGMTNSLTHYKRVVSAMIQARWDGLVDFDTFSDHDREMIGETEFEETLINDEISRAKGQIRLWMTSYKKNRWENQDYYPEVFIEKKALQGVFGPVCERNDVSLGACKGYPSLTFLNDAARRFEEATLREKVPIILYFGDYDPSGEDIPRSIEENLDRMGVVVEVRRIALNKKQVIAWKLPPAPIKPGDSRSAAWDGLGQVELDAVEPNTLRKWCQDAIDNVFDSELNDQLINQETDEREVYVAELKEYVKSL